MSAVTEEVDEYIVNYVSHRDGKRIAPYIYCFKKRKNIGKITFGDTGEANENRVDSGILEVHYPLSSFRDIIDILRNEKPLYLSVLKDRHLGALTTTDEPVGEEER